MEARMGKRISFMHTVTRTKVNWTCHILRINCFLKHVIEGKVAGTGRRGIRPKQIRDGLIKREEQEIEIENTRSQAVEDSHWKNRDCEMDE
jgi:hypothetical protein